MKNITLLFFCCLTICFLGCRQQVSSQKDKPSSETLNMSKDRNPNFIQEAEKRFQGTYEALENKRFILCFFKEEGTVMRPQSSTDYFVFNKEKSEVIYEGNVFNGTVKWLDEQHLEIYSMPGIMREGQTRDDMTLIINVLNGEKISKSDFIKEGK